MEFHRLVRLRLKSQAQACKVRSSGLRAYPKNTPAAVLREALLWSGSGDYPDRLLAAGYYLASPLMGGASAADLEVNTNGGFADYMPAELPAFGTLILQLQSVSDQ